MPEWNIQRIEKFDSNKVSPIHGMYHVRSHDETFGLFVLNNKKIRCSVARELNYDGRTIATIGEEAIFTGQQISYYEGTHSVNFNTLVIPDSFSKTFGIRQGNFLDFTIISLVKGNEFEEVFPKKRANGIIAINPSNERMIPSSRISDSLLEFSIKDEFFNNLIQEINDTYAYGLYRSTHVLLRTLFENLIIKLLKEKFRSDKKELYLTKNNNYLDFSKLIDNFKANKHDFAPHAKSFDDEFFEFLDKFREKANASAHILEVYLDKDSFDKFKGKMNQYIKIIDYVTSEIGSLK